MSNEPSEEIQHTLYMDMCRNWSADKHGALHAPKVFLMSNGRIGMEYGGMVVVKTIGEWMALDTVFKMNFHIGQEMTT